MMVRRILAGILFAVCVGCPSAAAAGAPPPAGLHLPQTKRANFAWVVTDGAGYRWDIQYYGTVGKGTSNAYSGGVYCQVWGTSVNSGGVGWVAASEDEIEIGPFVRNNVRIYRRVKVFKDIGLARWVDIFENPTGAEVTVPVRIFTSTNYPIKSLRTSSGADTFGPRDYGFVRTTAGNNTPAVMAAVSDPRAAVRPEVVIKGNSIQVNYSLTIGAGKTVVLCHFESQDRTADDAARTLSSFRAIRALKDLPVSVRRLIVNWRVGGGLDSVDLERSDRVDTLVEINGDRKLGTVLNTSFTLATLLGEITLPAQKVLGMVRLPGSPGAVRVVISGGQVLSGTIPDGRITLQLSVGGTLQVPVTRISHWSYRISPQRPAAPSATGPTAALRTGDRLEFDAAGMTVAFQTRHGLLTLRSEDLQRIDLDNSQHALHRATLLNGSTLAGLLVPTSVPLALRLGKTVTIERDMIRTLVLAAEPSDHPALTRVELSNGDELLGVLETPSLTVSSDYGRPAFAPRNIRSIVFDPEQPARAAVTIWDGTVVRGLLRPETINVRVVPGPVVAVSVGHIRSITRADAQPPDAIIRTIERLVAQLGAESYTDRDAAREALKAMGAGIVPLLRNRFLADEDPEVRQSIEEIVNHLGGKPTPGAKTPQSQPAGQRAMPRR